MTDISAFHPEYFVPGILAALLFLFCICNPYGKGSDVAQRGFTEVTEFTESKRTGWACKWVFICLIIPFYILTICISFYAFGATSGLDIITDFCEQVSTDIGITPKSGCLLFVTFGLESFDDAACVPAETCDPYAKQGSNPLGMSELGLGAQLPPAVSTIAYTCTDQNVAGECIVANATSGDGFSLSCNNCSEWAGVANDSPYVEPFSFELIECSCVNEVAPCLAWDCTVSEYPYFFPNALWTCLAGFLYLLPLLTVIALNIKWQCQKKLIPCADVQVFKFGSGGGIEVVGSDLASGSSLEAQATKDKKFGYKARSFSRFDVALYLIGIPAACVLVFLMWKVAGVFGFAMLGLDLALILVCMVVYCAWFLIEQCKRTNNVVDYVNNSH